MAVRSPLQPTFQHRAMTATCVLERHLLYQFQNRTLLEEALTHSSVPHGAACGERRSFDRLEFLGDRVLNLVVADLLYKQFPADSEGDLAKRFAALVCFETCADVALTIGIPEFFRVASVAVLSDQRVLCDAMEALLGAMYLDGGIGPCAKFIMTYWGDKVIHLNTPPKEAKTALQEAVQASGRALPEYVIIEKSGTEHAPSFTVEVRVSGFTPIAGQGSSHKSAEKDAAARFLKKFGNQLSTQKSPSAARPSRIHHKDLRF